MGGGAECRARPTSSNRSASSDADVVIFYPYMYYPTVHSIGRVPMPAVLHPAAHDEPAFHKPLFVARRSEVPTPSCSIRRPNGISCSRDAVVWQESPSWCWGWASALRWPRERREAELSAWVIGPHRFDRSTRRAEGDYASSWSSCSEISGPSSRAIGAGDRRSDQ